MSSDRSFRNPGHEMNDDRMLVDESTDIGG